jgi:hypothetical protein
MSNTTGSLFALVAVLWFGWRLYRIRRARRLKADPTTTRRALNIERILGQTDSWPLLK